jgi:hypothetical protein
MKPTDKELALYEGEELLPISEELEITDEKLREEFELLVEYAIEYKTVTEGRSLTTDEVEQIKTDLRNEVSKGRPSGFGAKFQPAALPMETQRPPSDRPTLGEAVSMQQTVGEGRKAPATYSPTLDLNLQTKQKLIEMFKASQTPDAGVLSPEALKQMERDAETDAESLVFAYDRLTEQFPGMSPEQKMEEVISALQTMNDVPSVKESALDPEMIEKFKGQDWYDKLAKALSGQVTEGSFKAYTPVQADILSYQMKDRIDRYADRVYSTMFREPADLVSVKSPKGNFVVPREVFEYIGEVGLGTIYDNETDLAIRKAYLGEEGQHYGVRGREGQTIAQAPNKRDHASALSKVRAYSRIDYDWTLDNDRRQFIVDHLDDFKNEGWFTTTTAFGGVSETGTSWLLRNALALPNALTGAGISVAKDVADVGIELATGEEAPLAKATIAERQANAPIYAEDSFMADIYDSVARNKGFLDESDIVIEAFGIQDPYAKGVIYGTSAVADFLNPDLDIISGGLKGTQKAARAIQASRRLYDSTDYTQAAKAFAKGFNDEVMDSTNLISITNNTIKKVGGKTVDNLTDGDIRLTFGQQVARNLEAQDLMNAGKEEELLRLGLDDTPYYKKVQESGKEQADEYFFGNIRQNDNARNLYTEYQDTQRFLDDVEQFDYDTAVKRAKEQDLNINLKTIDDIVKSEAPLPIKDALPSIRKGVASVYGRGIMFEMAPSIRDMEAVVQVTPRLYASKKIADEIRITASLTDIGKRFYNINKLPFGEDIKPAEAAATELFGSPVIKEGRLTKFFDLSELGAEDKFQLKIDLDYLDIAPTKRAQIIEDIDNNKLYNDDLRMIIDRNTERALLTDGRVATVDDINRLDAVEQRKLLEAADTAARSGLREGPVMQATKSFLSNLIGEQIVRYIPDSLGKARRVWNNNMSKIMTPQVELRRSFNIQQSTALRKAEGQIQTLELRAQREYERLTQVMPADEALSHMIVGLPQSELGQISQMENIENALSWMVDQLFVRVGTTINADASAQSLISGYAAKISNEVFSADGLRYKEYLLKEVVKEAIQNPKILWGKMEDVILKLNDGLRKPRVTYINEDGVKQTVRVRGVTVKPDEIQLYRDRNLEDGMAQIVLGTYMATEIRRITKEVIVEQIDEQLIKVSVDNVLPNIDIKQQEYADLLRESTQILYANRNATYGQSIDDIGGVVQQYYRQKTLDALNELDPDFDYTNIRPEVKKVLDSFKKNIRKEGKNDKALFKELMGEDIKEKVKKYNELIDEMYQTDVKRIKQSGKDLVTKYKKQKFEEYDVQIKKYNRKKDKEQIKELRAKRNQEIADYAEQVRQQKNAEISMLGNKRAESKRQYLQSLREYQVNTIAQIKSKTQSAIEGLDEAWAATEGMSDVQLIKWLEDNDLPLSFQMQQLKSVMETDFVSSETSKIISEQLYDQSQVVMRNNRLNNDHIVPAKDMVELFDSMFGKENETLFKALLGEDVYDDLLESLQNRGYGFVQDNIRKVLQADPNLFDAVDKMHGYMKGAFYTAILGYRIKYHTQNIISAPAIIYQTLGSNKLFNGYNIKELTTKSRLIVKDGSSIGSRNYNKVAVTTKDGRSYTYGDLFEALEETGAKTEFTYIMSSLRDGQLLKDIQYATRKPGVGIGDSTMNVLTNMGRNINALGDYVTGFASNCDMTFRAAVLMKGLEDGKSLDESAKLASRSLFDYNEINFQGIGGRIVNSAFVFTSFFISNNFDLMRAFSDPSILKRYAYTLKVTRDLNKLQRVMNDDQDLPYEMYYPDFAQPRIRYGYKEDKLGRDAHFKMLPPLPAIEALQFQSALLYASLGSAVGHDVAYTDVAEQMLNMLDPLLKTVSDVVLDTNFANVYSYTPLSYVQLSSTMSNGDPQDIAAQIEWLTGSQVYPQYVGPDKLNNHNGYLYKFKDKEQAKVFKTNFIRTFGSLTGAETMINAALRPFAPQGSTYGELTNTERLGALLGFFTPARMETPEKQQLELMRGTLSNIRKMKNQYEKQILDQELAPKNTDED